MRSKMHLTSQSATQSSSNARRRQILRDGFDSRMEPITFKILRVAADKSASSLLLQLLLELSVQYNLKITSVISFICVNNDRVMKRLMVTKHLLPS